MTYSKNSGTALTARRRTDSQKNKVILIQFAHSHSTYLENRTRQRSAIFTRLKKSLRILPKSNKHKTNSDELFPFAGVSFYCLIHLPCRIFLGAANIG